MNNQEPDFVSLKDVLFSLAKRVTVHVLDRYADIDEPDFIPDFRASLYRYSAAAEALESQISLTPATERPRWLDLRWGMGTARATETAENEGVHQLKQWTEVFPSWVNSYRASDWDGHDEKPIVRFPDLMFVNLSNLDFVQKVGFERGDMVRFLKARDISYSLADDGAILAGSRGNLGLSTPDIATAFAKLGDWTDQEWAKYLPQVKWAKAACVQKGGRGKGRAARWDPVRLAQLATPVRKVGLPAWGRRFHENMLLQPWLEKWLEYERQDHWYRTINPVRKP